MIREELNEKYGKNLINKIFRRCIFAGSAVLIRKDQKAEHPLDYTKLMPPQTWHNSE